MIAGQPPDTAGGRNPTADHHSVWSKQRSGLYLRTPGMRQQGSLRPTENGVALAKDA
ncbi:MAG: hypothetical protein ACRDQH_02200 [Pseudonocardiaceae bacterium]